jgi:DNA repair exonuclease SbcCD ATPase subunit
MRGEDLHKIKEQLIKANRQMGKDRAKEELLIKDWQIQQAKIESLNTLADNLLKVRALFQSAAEATQKQLEFHISGLVSSALSAVWDNPYEFVLEFVQKRGKTEAELWIERDGERMKPLDAAGGGVVDIISLALRMAFWSLTKTSRPLLLLDEPLKQLSADKQSKASDMLKSISEKLGIQILMVTHEKALLDAVDKQFEVKLVNGISEVV